MITEALKYISNYSESSFCFHAIMGQRYVCRLNQIDVLFTSTLGFIAWHVKHLHDVISLLILKASGLKFPMSARITLGRLKLMIFASGMGPTSTVIAVCIAREGRCFVGQAFVASICECTAGNGDINLYIINTFILIQDETRKTGSIILPEWVNLC